MNNAPEQNHWHKQTPPPSSLDNEQKESVGNTSADSSEEYEVKKERPIGELVSIIIIVGLLIVGALYFWGKWIDTQAQQEATLQNLYNQENIEVVE